MKILNLFIISCFILFSEQVVSQSIISPIVNDQLSTVFSVQMKGFIGNKLDASYQNRILAQDVDRLIAPFNNRTESSCWQSEFWGKWFTSAILAYRYRPEPKLKKVLDKAVEGLIASQTTDGYIGNYADDKHLANWDIWGRKYCMLGLIAYYDVCNDQKALKAASREADYLMKELKDRNVLIVNMGNMHGMAASSVLEPICLLYARTGNKKYLEFAEEIVRQWETADGPQLISKSDINVSKRFPKAKNWFGKDQGLKAYEMMSCYEGLLELYRLTGKVEYKKAVEETWNNIRDKEINIVGSGSAVECWFGGKELQTISILHYQETCVTATWIKLCQQLLRLTGEVKYADAIEQSYYNALLGAMKPNGSDWAKYTPLSGQRLEGSEQCGMGLNCCVASGPRGLFTFPLTAVMASKQGLQVNFFAEGTYSLQTPGKKQVQIIQSTDYPVTGKIHLKVQLQNPENMSLRIRIPDWSKKSILIVNGEPIKSVTAGEYVDIQRVWKEGDLVDLDLDMRGRVIGIGKLPEYFAIVRGPIVLSRDMRLTGPSIESIIKPVSDKDGYIKLEPIEQKDTDIWMEFKASFIPESYTEGPSQPISVVLCDYSSAGNTNEGHPQFKVWLPQLLDMKKIDE